MLTLSRTEGSETYLDLPNGDRITVTVRDIKDTRVILSFDAPKDVKIIRDNAVVKTLTEDIR